jgi:flagellar biosynthesis/type III secretory pathway chaperone
MSNEVRDQEAGVCRLSHLLEEEITKYDRLIQEMKRESECLRKGSTESLMDSIRVLDGYQEAILASEKEISQLIEKILEGQGGEAREPTLSDVLEILPRGDLRKIKTYQQTLRTLKNRARKINEQNKSFIQEYLSYLDDLLSFVIGPRGEVPGYPQRGSGRTLTPLPQALNREV